MSQKLGEKIEKLKKKEKKGTFLAKKQARAELKNKKRICWAKIGKNIEYKGKS